MQGEHVLDVVAVRHIGVRRFHGAVDRLDVADEHKDAACKDEQHSDDAENADAIKTNEEVWSVCVSASSLPEKRTVGRSITHMHEGEALRRWLEVYRSENSSSV